LRFDPIVSSLIAIILIEEFSIRHRVFRASQVETGLVDARQLCPGLPLCLKWAFGFGLLLLIILGNGVTFLILNFDWTV